MSTKNIIFIILAIICIIIISIGLFFRNSENEVNYLGLGESSPEVYDVKNEIVLTEGNTFLNSDKIEFVQRIIKGGGSNPGWVISLLETQPNVFTGRVIVDDGVYQHPVTLREEATDVFVGEMKSKDGKKEVFNMKKKNQNCTDGENTVYEYTLSGIYGATQFAGCGGDVLSAEE